MTKTSTDAQIVGSVSFINGDAQQFTDAKEYLDCIREELPHEATTGFRFRTITQDPAVRKAVDDIVFDLYGEENPYREEDYNLAPSEEMQILCIRFLLSFWTKFRRRRLKYSALHQEACLSGLSI